MKLKEILVENAELGKPKVFVDMDGVLADLASHAIEFHDVDHYKHMSNEDWEAFFKDSDAYHLFRDIRPFSSANQLIDMVRKYAGSYNILSSPLKVDAEGCIRGKREWLSKNINAPADHIIFEREKYKYAVQPDGTPNILIDDYGVNIRAWNNAGGIAIKYQASESPISVVEEVLQNVFGKDK
jgi:5'(3')-deoxyribonucleotidase